MPDTAPHLRIELFPAADGDALLLQFRDATSTINILVDGGPRRTFANSLEARLHQLHSEGQALAAVIVTHIDTDHIGGILALLKENGPAVSPRVIRIDDVWHNGYRHLALPGRSPTQSEKLRVLSQTFASEDSPTDDISVREADTLAALITAYGYAWNGAYGGRAIVAGDTVSLANTIRTTVLSPNTEALERLAYQWRQSLLEMGVSHEAVDCPAFAHAFEANLLSAPDALDLEATISAADMIEPPPPDTFVEDTSPTNGSSMAFLMEWRHLRLLLLGDSWPSVVESTLKTSVTDHRAFDVVKVSHHGSRHNTSPSLSELAASRRYIVSTDGSKHALPNIESMLWLAAKSVPNAAFIFNYNTATATWMADERLTRRYGHHTTIGDGVRSIAITVAEGIPDGT
ncbi:MAG: MBL fold metallo-hydrolase [Planctomycetia bacterium]|nr:MBL fold metallo-hydrolase [Planctomycetia bacterium]